MDYKDRSKAFREYLDENLPKVNLEEKPMKIKVIIEEHISQEFEVEAVNLEEATEIAAQKYYSGEFVVEPKTPTAKLMMADDGIFQTEWEEF